MERNRYRSRIMPGMQQGDVSESPFPCRIVSNGEFQPILQTQEQSKVERLILEHSERLTPSLGMNRRDFLRTSGGMAVALLAMNSEFGKFFDVSEVEAAEPAAFAERKGEPYFIFDIQTHYVSTKYDPGNEASRIGKIPKETLLRWRARAREEGWNPDLKDDPANIEDLHWQNFVKEVFLDSETTLAVISTPPAPYPWEAVVPPREMTHIRDQLNHVTNSQRVLAHGLVAPQLGERDREFMAMQAEKLKVDAWKAYTGYPAKGQEHGWWMSDEKIAYPMLEQARRLKIPLVCVHKGLPLGPDEDYSRPHDLIKAAKDFPDIAFAVYHSALKSPGTVEKDFRKTGKIPGRPGYVT